MSEKKLEQEAMEFKKEKTPKLTAADKTALRFYFGNALGGMISGRDSRQRPMELVNEAYEYAKMAKQLEDDKFGGS